MVSLSTSDPPDYELEKLVFLTNAWEDNEGLCYLVWELEYYDSLSIGEKFTLASSLVKDLISDGLLVLVEYDNLENLRLEKKVRTVGLADIDGVLKEPRSWSLNQEPIFAVDLTEKGEVALNISDEGTHRRLMKRMFGMEKPWG